MSNRVGSSGNQCAMILIALALVIAVMSASFYYVVVKPAQTAIKSIESIADTIINWLNKLFGITLTKTTIEDTVVVEEAKPILELAVVTRKVFEDHKFTKIFIFMKSTYHIQGVFIAKAGFDLRSDSFKFVIENGSPPQVTVYLPEPTLLSLELQEFDVRQDTSTLPVPLDGDEREREFKKMKDKAKEEVLNAGILEETKTHLEDQIQEILEDYDVEIEFRYSAPIDGPSG